MQRPEFEATWPPFMDTGRGVRACAGPGKAPAGTTDVHAEGGGRDRCLNFAPTRRARLSRPTATGTGRIASGHALQRRQDRGNVSPEEPPSSSTLARSFRDGEDPAPETSSGRTGTRFIRQVLSTSTGHGPMCASHPDQRRSRPGSATSSDHILTAESELVEKDDAQTRRKRNRDGEIVDVSTSGNGSAGRRTRKHLYKLFRAPVPHFHRPTERSPLPPYLVGLLLGDGDLTNGRVQVTTVPTMKSLPTSEDTGRPDRAETVGRILTAADVRHTDSAPVFEAGSPETDRPTPSSKASGNSNLPRPIRETTVYPDGHTKPETRLTRLHVLAGLMDRRWIPGVRIF